MNPGDEVTVTEGAWSGATGVVMEVRGLQARVKLDTDQIIMVRQDWLT